MATMIDLLEAAQENGLPVEVTPDFLTNGHGVNVLSPELGYLHHTVAKTLESVYRDPQRRPGWPTSEWRPDVPVPRCQVYAARARADGCRPGCRFKGEAHLVFVSAGIAYQAGPANASRIAAAKAGRITAAVPDAAAAGLLDDYQRANSEAMGIEIDWMPGEGWPPDLVDLICRLMLLAVKTFRWPGLGCWIRHRQATRRKTDPDTDFDFWNHARQLDHQAADEEDDMPTGNQLWDTNLVNRVFPTEKNASGSGDSAGDRLILAQGEAKAARIAAEAANAKATALQDRVDAMSLDLSAANAALGRIEAALAAAKGA